MASKLIAFIAIQVLLVQSVYTQCINRVPPTLGPNMIETILPNQVLYREPILPILPAPCAGPVLPTPVYQNPIIPAPVVSEVALSNPTIIQDGSVSNSLAHALQLLVVSNLLSTTLPGPYDVPAAMPLMPYEVMGMPAFNYIY